MKRSEIRRVEREKNKGKANFNMTALELEKIRRQEYERAKRDLDEKEQAIAKDIFRMMIVIPTNVLISDYWPNSSKKRIPEFVKKCMDLYEAWTAGCVSMTEMQNLTEEYAGIKLIDDNSATGRVMRGK